MKSNPQNIAAEFGIIGSILKDPNQTLHIALEKVNPLSFHHPAHQIIFSGILELWQARQPLDLITVSTFFREKQTFDEIGGFDYMLKLFDFPTAANIGTYIEEVREKFILRQLIQIGENVAFRAHEPEAEPSELLNQVSAAITEIASSFRKLERKTMKQLAYDKADRMESNDIDSNTLETGIASLDRKSPICLGSMPLIAGERKAGKSMLALNIALNISKKGRVVYFSLEDCAIQVADRIFSNLSRLPLFRHKSTGLNNGELNQASGAIDRMSTLNMQIYDDVYDLGGICANIRREKMQHPETAAVVVDYAQLVTFTGKKSDNREQIVATISRTFRQMAIELKIAIILLTQLNQDGATRESKALEQDATAMIRVDRVGDDEEDNGKRLIVIPWQRNGTSGVTFPISFRGEIATFTEMEHEK